MELLLVGVLVVGLALAMLAFARPPGNKINCALSKVLRGSPRPPVTGYCIFVSYRHKDAPDIVGRLTDGLIRTYEPMPFSLIGIASSLARTSAERSMRGFARVACSSA